MVIGLVLIGFGGYRYWVLWGQFNESQTNLASTTADLLLKTDLLASTTAQRNQFFNELTEEQKQTLDLANEIDRANDKVDELKKIVETDKELLQKYSKVFFLNEHYVPSKLVDIPTEYLEVKNRPEQIHGEVWSNLRRLIRAAKNDDIVLTVVSGYRSFEKQTSLKSVYTVSYGVGANKFSADQGYSEHQLGTAVDFNTPGLVPTSLTFANSPAYQWLVENAHRFGFVLSYPKNNVYYQFEPWHWRFVGEDLADDLFNNSQYFYDLDQREIDTYLGKIFD